MPITSYSIQNDIESLQREIINMRKAIQDAEEAIEKKKVELEKVLQYENRPREQKELLRRLYRDTPTVQIMDEFESLTQEGYCKYERLVLLSSFYHCGTYFSYVVERRNGRECFGDITMTELKKEEYWELLQYAKETIDRHNKRKKTTRFHSGTVIYFKKPYRLRAQTSSNRTGYGNYYEGYDLVIEGTLYGDTTDYVILGVMPQRDYFDLY